MNSEKYMGQELSLKLEKLDVDVNIGIKYCGDEDFYKEILDIAYESYLERAPKLDGYFKESDYNNYIILVHSIKSGAANIGAMKLSDMARALEDAGKNEDYEYINNNHKSFADYYDKVMIGLSDLLKLKNDADKDEESGQCFELQDITSEALRDKLEKIMYCLEELELDMAQELISRLLRCKLNSNERDVLNSIKTLLESFSVEGAKEKLHILLKEKY